MKKQELRDLSMLLRDADKQMVKAFAKTRNKEIKRHLVETRGKLNSAQCMIFDMLMVCPDE